VFSGCLGALIWYIWNWVTKEIKPVIGQANDTLLELIDRVRMLDNDLIRLNQKVETVMELRGERIEKETEQFDDLINNQPPNKTENGNK
jgi:hypothetical protein